VGKKRRATIPIFPQLYEALREACELQTTDYVVGFRSRQMRYPRKAITSAAARARIGRLGKHDLRHTAATWMIMDGRPKTEVAEFFKMTIAMIKRFYGHFLSDFLRDASRALEL
jgi:integrase